jgi:hypothetical protein
MGNLSNLFVSKSFQSLIHLATDNTASANLIGLEDGFGNPIGVSVNTAGDLSLSGSLTASLQSGYVWVGNSTGKTITVPTSSFGGGGSVPAGTISGSAQITAFGFVSGSYETTGRNIVSSSAQISGLGFVSSSITASSLVTASFSGNTLTFTKGDASTFGVVIPDVSGSTISTGSLLLTASASPTANTITFTKGDNTTFNVTLNITSSTSASFNTGSFATTGSNSFTGSQSISGSIIMTGSLNVVSNAASSIVNTGNSAINLTSNVNIEHRSDGQVEISSPSGQAGIKLTPNGGGGSGNSFINFDTNGGINYDIISIEGVTTNNSASLQIKQASQGLLIAEYGPLKETRFYNKVDISGSLSITGSLSASLNQGYVWVGDSNNRTVLVATSSFGGGSVPAGTISGSAQITALGFVSSSITASSLITASISGQLLSFTKGNNSQFTLLIPTGSGVYVTGSYGAFQDSTTQSGSANTAYKMKFNTTDVSDGVILSGSTGLKVGAYGTYNLQWSGQAVQGSGAAIVSVWVNVNGIEISGSRGDVTLSSNTKLLPAWNYFLTLNALDVVELLWASDSGNTTWQYLPIGTTPTTPAAASIIASLNRVDVGGGSNSVSNTTFNAYTASVNSSISQLNASSASQQISIDNLNQKTGSFATTGSNTFVGEQIISSSLIVTNAIKGTGSIFLQPDKNDARTLEIYNTSATDTHITASGGELFLGNDETYVLVNTYANQKQVIIRGDEKIIASGSLDISGSLTSSLQQGYVWVGNASNRTALVATSSFGGGGAAFPYTGSAQITGSLGITGSLSSLPITLSVSSNTASLNMTAGNNFVLTLPSSSTTHITAANLVAGQTLNLLVKQQVGPETGSITFAPFILFPSGLDMQATATGSAIDLVSMISFDTTNLMAANVKNLK